MFTYSMDPFSVFTYSMDPFSSSDLLNENVNESSLIFSENSVFFEGDSERATGTSYRSMFGSNI